MEQGECVANVAMPPLRPFCIIFEALPEGPQKQKSEWDKVNSGSERSHATFEPFLYHL
jgi:hypothetical protein